MEYSIQIGDIELGTTKLENADAPMGVVFGDIKFVDQNMGYEFVKNYCESMGIELASDYPEDKLLSTTTIGSLMVKNEKGVEIKGIGNQISGMDNDVYQVTILGVPYPFYEKEFPHHVKTYNELFNE